MAIVVAGMPTDIIMDCYAAYKPALARLQKDMKEQDGRLLNHIAIRSKDLSTLHLPPQKPENGISRHNNIENAWAKIKRNMDISQDTENIILTASYITASSTTISSDRIPACPNSWRPGTTKTAKST